VNAAEDVALSGHRRRLRPIAMAALAAVAGMLPLAVAVGAGSQMLQPLAIAVTAASWCRCCFP
jgi:multidrug efflux pump subunit AcrB